MKMAVWIYESPTSPWPLFLTESSGWSRKLSEARHLERDEAERLAQEFKGGTHIIRQ
jgi:hypothetical protein